VQDEIGFADGRFRLVPAVRVDHYRLRPEVDAIFAADNPDFAVTDLSATSVSPKLGAVWHLAAAWSLFGGYARGFRSPPYSDVNIGFTNLMFGYTAIANPDLKPETSDGVELGLRYVGDAAYASLSAYDNRYHDFIESFAFAGFNDEGLMVFQSQNVSDARIRGVELKAGIDFGALSGAMAGWSLRGSAAWARGDNRTDDVPLESIDPLTATLGVAYANDTWGAELAGRFAARRDRLPPAEPTAYYETPGYGVLDLLAHWRFAPGAKLNVGVFNLAERKIIDAGDIALVAADSTTLDRYSSPGRNLSMSVAFDW
jgi:hemoglobin/transferrin/lactoferrin receptor protein